LGDLINYYDVSLTGNIQLNTGDSIFVQVQNITGTNAFYAGYVTGSTISLAGSIPNTDGLSQGTNNFYLSTNGGTSFENVTGSVSNGHAAIFSGTTGLLADSGFPLNTSAAKFASDNTKTYVSSVFGATTAGHLLQAADTLGTVQDSGIAASVVVLNNGSTYGINISGTATNATNIGTTSTGANNTFYPLFVGSSSSGNQAASLNSTFAFNPATGLNILDLQVGAITGTTFSNSKAIIFGADSSSSNAPGMSFFTTADAYPLMTVMPLTHGNNTVNFGAYYTGTWLSSDSTSNYQIQQLSGILSINYSSSNAQGAGISWSTGLKIDTSGHVNIPNLMPSQTVVTDGSGNLASLINTNSNIASTIVKRDSSGNFSSGTITASLSGNATTSTTAINATNGATVGVGSNAAYYPLFAASSSNSNQPFNLNTGLSFNPSTSILSTTGVTLSGLTQNSVIFAGASGALSQDTTNLYYESTPGKLSVHTGAANGAYNTLYFQVGASAADIGSYVPNNSPIVMTSKTNNGGSSPAASEPVEVWMRQGVSGQSFANIVDWEISRTANVGLNSNTLLELGLTGASGEAETSTIQSWGNSNGALQTTIGTPQTIVQTSLVNIIGSDGSGPLGPTIDFYTTADQYPVLQILGYQHNNSYLAFDAYFTTTWRSGSSGSNYAIGKNGSLFIEYATGVTASNLITWTTGWTFDTSGNFQINKAGSGLQIKSAASGSNATFVTGVTLTAGASGTINNTAVTISHVGFAVATTRSGTATTQYQVTCGSGTFSVSGGSLDTSTLAVFFIKPL
jgi:hypothetical protein